MTVLDDRPPVAPGASSARPAPDGPRTGDRPLASIAGLVGTATVGVISAPRGADVPVRGVTIWDGTRPHRVRSGDLVLAVGLMREAELAEVFRTVARAGGAAVTITRPADGTWARSEAERAGIGVLALPDGSSWDDLYRAVSTAVACPPSPAGGAVASAGGDPFASRGGDLFTLADVVATELGGPVEIDDPALCLLAYSSVGHDLDEVRRTSILTRRAPERLTGWMRDSGLVRRLGSSDLPLEVQPPGAHPRLVVPVRAGSDLWGYLWVARGDGRFGAAAGELLREAAAAAATIMVRARLAGDPDRRARREALRGVLERGDSPEALRTWIGDRCDARLQLLGLGPDGGWPRDSAEQLRVEEALAQHLGAARLDGCAGSVAGQVYALVRRPDDAAATVRAVVDRVLSAARPAHRTPLVAAIGLPFGDLAELPSARREVDALLGMRRAGGLPAVRVAEEWGPRSILAEFGALLGDRPWLSRGPVRDLHALDQAKGTRYLETMRAYFDARFDLTEAAAVLRLHRNTVRYRLERIHELVGLDLMDSTERLVAELQLHLFEPGDAQHG